MYQLADEGRVADADATKAARKARSLARQLEREAVAAEARRRYVAQWEAKCTEFGLDEAQAQVPHAPLPPPPFYPPLALDPPPRPPL